MLHGIYKSYCRIWILRTGAYYLELAARVDAYNCGKLIFIDANKRM